MGLLSIVALVVFLPIEPLREFQLPVLLNALWCIKIVLIGKISEYVITSGWGQRSEVKVWGRI